MAARGWYAVLGIDAESGEVDRKEKAGAYQLPAFFDSRILCSYVVCSEMENLPHFGLQPE